ncbi:MAG: 50S ribosomal protein L22 [Chlamydiae bacterium]|nr:MAG: 50S ribosomal protein L22 [Chlamydiota bacterium]
MEAKAILKKVRTSPQKARLITTMIQGHPVNEALKMLRFSSKKAAKLTEKVLKSAIANAVNKGADEDQLTVISAYADAGPVMKRFLPASRGRAMPIIKRTAHISIVVGEK